MFKQHRKQYEAYRSLKTNKQKTGHRTLLNSKAHSNFSLSFMHYRDTSNGSKNSWLSNLFAKRLDVPASILLLVFI